MNEKELISLAKKIYKDTGISVPQSKSMELLGVNKKTITRKFGSWNNFLEVAKIPLNSKPIMEKEERECECGCGKKFVVIHSNKKRFFDVSCSNRVNKLKHGNYIEGVEKFCLNCNELNERSSSPFCSTLCKCFFDSKQITKQSLMKRGGANTYDNIRHRAKSIVKQINNINKCFVCGYSNHVEVCHIKDIKDFSNDTVVYEINKLTNLSMLCPNHHYEFDKGLVEDVISIEEYLKILDKKSMVS